MDCNSSKPDSLDLKNMDLLSTCPESKRTSRDTNHQRILMKLYLSKQILEQSLESFDIFRQILEDPLQKNKLIRDVIKTIKLTVLQKQDLIYSKGDISESIFMVLKGIVALCLPVAREQNQNGQIQYQFQQIDSFQEGMGFGQAEFVHGKKRSLAAQCKYDGTVIGSIGALAFQEIIQLYRQRVYYKKMEMFSRCTLLKSLKPHQLQFVINNAKPVHFPISKQIISQGEFPKALYLITQGQVELHRQQRAKVCSPSRLNSKKKDSDDRSIVNRLVIGLLEQGSFLGDCEIALSTPFTYTAVCKSERVKAYVCNEKIIQSQVGVQWFDEVRNNYANRFDLRENQLKVYQEAKQQVEQELNGLQKVLLTNTQQKIKRKILNRYAQKKPTIVGKLSPHQISLSLKRKEARIKSISNSQQLQDLSFLPVIGTPTQPLKRNHRAFSPLLKRQLKNERKYSEPSEAIDLQRSMTLKESCGAQEQFRFVLRKGCSETRQLKGQKLGRKKCRLQQRKGTTKGREQQHQLSAIQMRRLYQFISKLQHRVHNNDN